MSTNTADRIDDTAPAAPPSAAGASIGQLLDLVAEQMAALDAEWSDTDLVTVLAHAETVKNAVAA